MDSKCGINFKTGRCVNIAGKRRGVVVTGNDGANVCKLSKNDRCELTPKGREFSTRTLKTKARNNINFAEIDETGTPVVGGDTTRNTPVVGSRSSPQMSNDTDTAGNLVKGLGILSSFLRNQQRRKSKKRRRRSRKRKRSKSRKRKRSKSRKRRRRRRKR